MNDLILYTTEDGRNTIRLRTDQNTVWLTQLEMAELFDATKQNISLHLKNLFEDGELDTDSVVKESLTTAADGKRYKTLLYNLDAAQAEKIESLKQHKRGLMRQLFPVPEEE